MRIGVFDSGVGGITVLTELQKRFPRADFVYLGDTAHVPYGSKSPAQIEKLSLDCAQILLHKKIDALVVACNTAASWALPAIEKMMAPLPVFGVVQPGVEAALKALENGSRQGAGAPGVLILATRATVRSQAYGKLIRSRLKEKKASWAAKVSIFEQACPLLVPMIEEGWIRHPILFKTIAEYVQPFVEKHPPGVALLGCTHYPWIHQAFEECMPKWTVVNSAYAVAESLEKSALFQQDADFSVQEPKQKGSIEWLFTDPQAVPEFAQQIVRDLRGGLE